MKCSVTQVTSGNRVKNIRPIFSLLTGERCYRCRISRQARAYLSSEGASHATELLSHNAGGGALCIMHRACLNPARKRITLVRTFRRNESVAGLLVVPGHFFRPCVGVESQPVLLERKHRRDEMRGGKKLEKCNQRDFTFCQVGNLKVHQKWPTGSLIFFDPRYFGLLTPRA